MTGDLQARAREIAAGLTDGNVQAIRMLAAGKFAYKALWAPKLFAAGIVAERQTFDLDGFTDLGRAVARVLAEGGAK